MTVAYPALITKHDTPRSKHRDHDPRVKRHREEDIKQRRQRGEKVADVSRVDDEMREAISELGLPHSDQRPPTDWGALRHNLQAHIENHAAYMPEEASERFAQAMSDQLDFFEKSEVLRDLSDVNEYMLHAVNAVAYQEMHTWQRQLGDHGVWHITGNMEIQDEMLRQVQDRIGHVTNEDRLMASVAQVYHDIGYTAGGAASTVVGTKEHPHIGGDYVRQNDMFKKLFGSRGQEQMAAWIDDHQGSTIDWAGDPVGTSLRLSDNLALFSREKLPAYLRYVPGATEELLRLGASLKQGDKGAVKKSKAKLRELVDGSEVSDALKDKLHRAVDDIFEQSPRFTLGMFAGELMKPRFDGETMHVPVRYNEFSKVLQDAFELGQTQFAKVASDYGVSEEQYQKGEFSVPGLHVKVLGAPKGVFQKHKGRLKKHDTPRSHPGVWKHQPGGHDQKKHGRRSVDNEKSSKALEDYLDMMSKFRQAPEGWRYGSYGDLLKQRGTRYGGQEFTVEEEATLLDLFKGLGSCKAGECYMNATQLAIRADMAGVDGRYVEGYGDPKLIPVEHAWFELNGKPVDLTWYERDEEAGAFEQSRREGRVKSPKRLLERAKHNAKNFAYVGIPIPFKELVKTMGQTGFYGGVLEYNGKLLLKEGLMPDEWASLDDEEPHRSGELDKHLKGSPRTKVMKHPGHPDQQVHDPTTHGRPGGPVRPWWEKSSAAFTPVGPNVGPVPFSTRLGERWQELGIPRRVRELVEDLTPEELVHIMHALEEAPHVAHNLLHVLEPYVAVILPLVTKADHDHGLSGLSGDLSGRVSKGLRVVDELDKHLKGEHDQKKHGRKRGSAKSNFYSHRGTYSLAEYLDEVMEERFRHWKSTTNDDESGDIDDSLQYTKRMTVQRLGAKLWETFGEEKLAQTRKIIEKTNSLLFGSQAERNSIRHDGDWVAHCLVKTWSISASDNQSLSVLIQLRAAQLFGVKRDLHWVQPETWAAVGKMVDEWPVVDFFLETIYKQTQDLLKHEGIKELNVFRGMRWEPNEVPDSMISSKNAPRVHRRLSELYKKVNDALYDLRGGNFQIRTGVRAIDEVLRRARSIDFQEVLPVDNMNSALEALSKEWRSVSDGMRASDPHLHAFEEAIPVARRIAEFIDLSIDRVEKALVKPEIGPLTLKLNPLSSFSLDEDVAARFSFAPSSRYTKMISASRIPAEAVFSVGATGLGSTFEKEVVVIGDELESFSSRASGYTETYAFGWTFKGFYEDD